MEISGIEVTPTTNAEDKSTQQFCSMPVLTGSAVEGTSANPCVAVEPIKAGKIGRVAVAGVVQVTMESLDLIRDQVAILWEGDDWGLVRIGGGGGGGGVRFGKIDATWLKGDTANVTQLKADGTTYSPTKAFTAKNWFVDIPIDCGERKVACAKVDGTWILIAAECL